MSREDIIPKLKSLLVEMLQLSDEVAASIKEDTDLIHDIGLNSIDALEFLVIVEREFSVIIDDEDLSAELIQTLGNLSDYLLKKTA